MLAAVSSLPEIYPPGELRAHAIDVQHPSLLTLPATKMALDRSQYKDREFIAVIGDEVGRTSAPIQSPNSSTFAFGDLAAHELMTTATGLCNWNSARRRWCK
jgi:hypothetical protein